MIRSRDILIFVFLSHTQIAKSVTSSLDIAASRKEHFCLLLLNPKGRVTYRFSYVVRYNDANNMTPTPCPMHHFQNFDKINCFLSKACFKYPHSW